MSVLPRRRATGALAAVTSIGLALTTGVVALAAGSHPKLHTTGGLWTSTGSARSLSATVYVSAISCKGVSPGQYAGQRSGAELFGSYSSGGTPVHPFDFAGYYSFCHGQTAQYRPEFLISDSRLGLLSFHTGGFPISPGDPLEITIMTTGNRVRLTIFDVNTHQHRTVSGPLLPHARGWAAGLMPLFGGGTGEPFMHGSVALLDRYSATGGPSVIPGPTPFAPVVFRDFKVNHQTLNSGGGGVSPSSWRGSRGEHVSVTHLHRGSFEATGRLSSPKLGKTVDVTPVSGTTLVQIPGTHRFVKLKHGQKIPDGSKIDARHGKVQITLGITQGRGETGVFYDGEFQLRQNSSSGNTSATLIGGNRASCPKTPTQAKTPSGSNSPIAVASAARAKGKGKSSKGGNAKPKGKKLRGLWANAHGNFTTKGSGGAAAVLGTQWYTEDTCDGTWFKVIRDKIKVTVYYPHRHTVVVTQGHSFFAPNKPPAKQNVGPSISIAPLSASNGRYNVKTSGYYTLVIVSKQRPAYVDAAVAPQLPSGGNNPLYPDGTVNGTPRWRIVFYIAPNLAHFQDWNVGVRIGGKLYILKLRVK